MFPQAKPISSRWSPYLSFIGSQPEYRDYGTSSRKTINKPAPEKRNKARAERKRKQKAAKRAGR